MRTGLYAGVMSISKRVGSTLGAALAPRITDLAPHLTAGFVHTALERAISGAGPLDGAAMTAEKQLDQHHGDVDEAIKDLLTSHVALASAEGALTNIGGLVTMAVLVPANVAGLALIQCRLVAAILHLRGYDLEDRRTRNAILASLLGEDRMLSLIKQKKLPSTPMALATAPVYDPQLDILMGNQVASELITRVAGKRVVSTVGRRIPLVGGLVGGTTDGYATWQIGRYVSREFLPRKRR